MNKENILKVADAIEQHSIPDLGFNMLDYVADADDDTIDHSGHSCGTVACIAGWSVAVKRGRAPRNWSQTAWIDARRFLGLNDDMALELFFAKKHPKAMSDIPPKDAVRVLRHLARTGEVDWSVADKVKADVA